MSRDGYEYRVCWQREGLRSRSTIRQTLEGARQKVDHLRGDFETVKDGGYGGVIPVPGADWLADQGVPPLEAVWIERRTVGAWSWLEGASDE